MLDIILPLIGLALIDSTSIGTLVIPIWLLLKQPLQSRTILIYLATITVFYFIIGVILFNGAAWLDTLATSSVITNITNWAQLILGLILLAISLRPSPKNKQPDKVSRLRQRIAVKTITPYGSMWLAIIAGVLEVATMLPYLGAVNILTQANLSAVATHVVLLLYCLVMTLPAIVLLIARRISGKALELKISAINRWLSRTMKESTSWLMGIAGFFILRDAVWRLGLLDALLPK